MNNEPSKDVLEQLLTKYSNKDFDSLLFQISKLKAQFPKSIFLLNLLGATYNELKNYEEAIKCFNKLLNINVNFADAYYNLAIIYRKINKIDKSINNYNQCIKINPKKFEALNNLGNIYKERNEIDKAVEKYLECLEINPNYEIALQNFGVCLQNFNFKSNSIVAEKHIINLLKRNKILRPVDIIKSLIHYIYLDPKFKLILESIKNLENTYPIDKLIDEVLDNKILICLLKITPITDIKIEKLIKYIRKKILLNLNIVKNREITFKIMDSIAKHCFINEYLYPIDLEEEEKLNKIEKQISMNIEKEDHDNDLEIACLAAYKPLSFYNCSNKIKINDKIADLINQQIEEPKKEIIIKNNIASNIIKNEISLKVMNQYEHHPYPRWTKIALNNYPTDVVNSFNKIDIKVDEDRIKNWSKINILVAGCGTGQHAITTATKYENSFVTAIDLSTASLSYAKRKSDELGLKNIDFIHLDILDLKKIKKKFEIIESVGVLHHMDDPFVGWKTLCDFLNPGGLIMIGLYSRFARQHISKIRAKIKKLNMIINNKNIINYREKIIDSNHDDFKYIKYSSDFYTTSSLRDLLFHTQEHNLDIPEIKKFISKLNLRFCGFENKQILNLFLKSNNKKNLYNLDTWSDFEIKNPDIFSSMYQFWCQKN